MSNKVLTTTLVSAALAFACVALWLNQPENVAKRLCQQTVQKNAKFPSKAEFAWNTDQTFETGYVGGMHRQRIIAGQVELMNGLGNMIPHKYQCVFDRDDKVRSFSVVPG